MTTAAARAQRLLAEARAAAMEQVQELDAALAGVAELSAQVAEGGDAYPAAIRDLCRRLSEETPLKAQTLQVIATRSLGGNSR